MTPVPSLYLASKSPRRRQLLEALGARGVVVLPADEGDSLTYRPGEEERRPGEAPSDYVTRMARDKAAACWAKIRARGLPAAPVLAADTAVVLGERILGKPRDAAQARDFLRALSGRTHLVRTAVCLDRGPAGARCLESVSEVRFADLSEDDISGYLATGEPWDKAGGYAAQGLAALFIEEIRGSFSGVIGLPVYETGLLLRPLGIIRLPPGSPASPGTA